MNPLLVEDSAKQTELKRKHNGNYIENECPDLIKKYNPEMGGVDWYNKLMLFFSVEIHIF